MAANAAAAAAAASVAGGLWNRERITQQLKKIVKDEYDKKNI